MSGLVRTLTWRDWFVPAVLWVMAQIWLWVTGPQTGLMHGPQLPFAVSYSAAAAVLCMRRRWPVAVLVALTVLTLATGTPMAYAWPPAGMYMVVVATFACGRYGETPWRYLALVLPELILVAELWVTEIDTPAGGAAWGLNAWWIFALGAAFRHERLLRERLALAIAAETRVTAATQRLATAREVHDVVSHSLSVVVVQAELAQLLRDSDPDGSRQAMERVQDTARMALGETRRLLDALRDPDQEEPGAHHTPGWSDVSDLVLRMRQSGLPVTLEAPALDPDLSPEVSAAAYRIVQEALTNVLRHAGQTATTVNLSYDDTSLVIDVRDRGGKSSSLRGSGYGLTGMRERVAACGGQLTAGLSADGGYQVRAVLPAGGPR